MQRKTIGEIRSEVEALFSDMGEKAKYLEDETDDEKFMMLFMGICTTVRVQFDSIRNDMFRYKEFTKK